MNPHGEIDTADEDDLSATKVPNINDSTVRKSCCRYGRGCTHLNDPSHREKFWHPYAPQFTGKLNESSSCF